MPTELREQVEHKDPQERRAMEHVWELLGHLEHDVLGVPTTGVAWEAIQDQLDAPVLQTQPSQNAHRRTPLRLVRARRGWPILSVAAVLAVLMLGALWWRTPVTVIAPRGAQQLVTLPDGSTVHLNSDSQLRYVRGFQNWPFLSASARQVHLEGEAFFDVVPGQRPFVVNTFNATVEVLGTTFNVHARQETWNRETRVTLASGRVQVTSPGDPGYRTILSEAGQTALVADAATSSSPLEVQRLDYVLAWRNKGFALVDQPLGAILTEIERRYNVSIDVQEGVDLMEPLYLFLDSLSAEQTISELCLAAGEIRFRETSRGFTIFKE